MTAPAEPTASAPPEGNPSSARRFDHGQFRFAAVLAAIGVAGGAFGAHGLASSLSASRLATFETAVRYLLVHALGLMILALLAHLRTNRLLRTGSSLMAAGILVFSGSLFLLVLLDLPWMGAITPVGGTLLIAGWVLVAVGVGRPSDR